MSEPLRVALVGATGLIGGKLIEACVGREDVRLAGIARREAALPPGARMEMFVAEPDKWSEVIEAVRPKALVCALGTTWAKAGKDEEVFRAVDKDLVLAVAQAAKEHGVERFVSVSSVGADPAARSFYLRAKGETDAALRKMGLHRLDILRPGLLRGQRDADRRAGERLGIMVAPLVNLLLHGSYRRYRAIEAGEVARAALAFAKRPAQGRFVHENDAILRAANSLALPLEASV
ncbi:NAD(P)H-binding protein [Qipengyuania sp. MTN3-11]|uniref:NAD(P)H-binding protein n=1 Tax=Qipengyuania sp. MTN3-11 TaxID=3056557 RepID=UPI0036F26A6B